jgi:hypothetical protein
LSIYTVNREEGALPDDLIDERGYAGAEKQQREKKNFLLPMRPVEEKGQSQQKNEVEQQQSGDRCRNHERSDLIGTSQPPRICGLRYFEATGKIGRKLVSGDVHGSSISGPKEAQQNRLDRAKANGQLPL